MGVVIPHCKHRTSSVFIGFQHSFVAAFRTKAVTPFIVKCHRKVANFRFSFLKASYRCVKFVNRIKTKKKNLMSNKILNMNVVVFLLNVLIVVVVSGGPAWREVHRGGGLRVGAGAGKNTTSSRGNGIRLGGSTRGGRISTTVAPEEEHFSQPTATATSNHQHSLLHVGMVLPSKLFGVREYTKAVTSAKYNLQRKLRLFKTHDIKVHIVMKEMTPSPTGNISFTNKNIKHFNMSTVPSIN